MAGTDERDVTVAAPETPLPGDDITVIPDGELDEPRRHPLVLIALGLAAVALIAGVVYAMNRSGSNTAIEPTAEAPVTAPPATTAKATPTTAKPVANDTPVSTPVIAPPVTQAPPVQVAPTAPPAPPTYPPTALEWNVPGAFTMKTGTNKTITVSAHNPTDGTITLPVPLQCAPRLDGSGVCPEMAQIVQPGDTAAATYVISANDIAPGAYVLSIENGLRTINVTVIK